MLLNPLTIKVDFADKTARELFAESLDAFDGCQLRHRPIIDQNGNTYIFMWCGDKVVNALVALLIQQNFSTEVYAGVICVNEVDSEQVIRFLQVLTQKSLPATELAENVPNKIMDKFDEYVPDDLLVLGYGTHAFDLIGFSKWLYLFFKNN